MEENCLEVGSQDFHGFTQRAQDTKGGFLSQDNKQAFENFVYVLNRKQYDSKTPRLMHRSSG